jgi:hypothetical protein
MGELKNESEGLPQKSFLPQSTKTSNRFLLIFELFANQRRKHEQS